MAALPPVPRFFMYEGSELDFGWMARCPRFAELRASPTNERLAEVEIRSLLVSSNARTRDPTLATLFYVPLWEVVSFRVGRCENTTHRDRMRAAWNALRASPYWKPRRGRPAGADHLLASTGCVEDNLKLSERLGKLLGPLLIPTIFGRDRAYSPYYKYSGIGRCTVEIPYVSNPHATALRRARGADLAGDEPFGGALSLSQTDDYRAAGLSDEQAAEVVLAAGAALDAARAGGRRRWLLSFQGSMHKDDLCCQPGKDIRRAVARLARAGRDVSIIDVPRNLSRARRVGSYDGGAWARLYEAQAALMVQSKYCLIPHGDTEVTSRLYTAIAAGCVPVVIANRLSGAFASIVPYADLWLKVDQAAFLAKPKELLGRLRAISAASLLERQRALHAHAADVVYDWPDSRVAANFLRTAAAGCEATRVDMPRLVSVTYRQDDRRYADDRRSASLWNAECACVREPPTFWWGPSSGEIDRRRRGVWPTEVCRCNHCSTLCEVDNKTIGEGHPAGDGRGGGADGMARSIILRAEHTVHIGNSAGARSRLHHHRVAVVASAVTSDARRPGKARTRRKGEGAAS